MESRTEETLLLLVLDKEPWKVDLVDAVRMVENRP